MGQLNSLCTIEVHEHKKLKYCILCHNIDPLNYTARTCPLGEWKRGYYPPFWELFNGRNWTLTLNLRAYSKNDPGDGKETGSAHETTPTRPLQRNYLPLSLYVAMSMVSEGFDWSQFAQNGEEIEWVFGKPCPIVLFILQFQKLQKVLIQLLPYSFLPDSIL